MGDAPPIHRGREPPRGPRTGGADERRAAGDGRSIGRRGATEKPPGTAYGLSSGRRGAADGPIKMHGGGMRRRYPRVSGLQPPMSEKIGLPESPSSQVYMQSGPGGPGGFYSARFHLSRVLPKIPEKSCGFSPPFP